MVVTLDFDTAGYYDDALLFEIARLSMDVLLILCSAPQFLTM